MSQKANQTNMDEDAFHVPTLCSYHTCQSDRTGTPRQALEVKMETAYALLSMFTCNNIQEEMCNKFYSMSQDKRIALEMKAHGCIPLLIQLIHPHHNDQNNKTPNHCLSLSTSDHADEAKNLEIRDKACLTLHQIISYDKDTVEGKREVSVLQNLEEIRKFSLKFIITKSDISLSIPHPCQALSQLLTLSFRENCKTTMCSLGALEALAEIIEYDTQFHGNAYSLQCITVRRYAIIILTNLTVDSCSNKASLCANRPFIKSLIQQFYSNSEELKQLTASLIRNLAGKADKLSKRVLEEMSIAPILIQSALEVRKELTLKCILTALWNLSSHSTVNKAEICSTEGALQFIISTLTYQSSDNTLEIIEKGGGVLRNISSHIAKSERYRSILRDNHCFAILLDHLKSPSLTIVSNACATLWNLSSRSSQDQKTLIELGAVQMLSNLVNSKHKMISMGSSATLKNLSYFRYFNSASSFSSYKSKACNERTFQVPSILKARKLSHFLSSELDESLAETCDHNLDSPSSASNHSYDSYPISLSQECHLPNTGPTSSHSSYPYHSLDTATTMPRVPHTSSLSTNSSFNLKNVKERNLPHESQQLPVSSTSFDLVQVPRPSSSIRDAQENTFYLNGDSYAHLFDNDELFGKEEPKNFSLIFTETSEDDLKIEEKPIDFSLKYNEDKFNQEIEDLSNSKSNLIFENVSAFSSTSNSKAHNTRVNSSNASIIGNEDSIRVYREEGTPVMPGSPLFNQVTSYNTSKSHLDSKLEESFDLPGPSLSSLSPCEQYTCKRDQSYKEINEGSIHSFDQTPLMYSRTSSVDSLSDCDVKSFGNVSYNSDSSVPSESKPSSPFELPDSPLRQQFSNLDIESASEKDSSEPVSFYNPSAIYDNFFYDNFTPPLHSAHQISKSSSQSNMSNPMLVSPSNSPEKEFLTDEDNDEEYNSVDYTYNNDGDDKDDNEDDNYDNDINDVNDVNDVSDASDADDVNDYNVDNDDSDGGDVENSGQKQKTEARQSSEQYANSHPCIHLERSYFNELANSNNHIKLKYDESLPKEADMQTLVANSENVKIMLFNDSELPTSLYQHLDCSNMTSSNLSAFDDQTNTPLYNVNPQSLMEQLSSLSSNCASTNSDEFDEDNYLTEIKDFDETSTRYIKQETDHLMFLTDSLNHDLINKKPASVSNFNLSLVTSLLKDQSDSEDQSKTTFVGTCGNSRIIRPVIRPQVDKKGSSKHTTISNLASTTSHSSSCRFNPIIVKPTKTSALRASKCKPLLENNSNNDLTKSNFAKKGVNKFSNFTNRTYVIRKKVSSAASKEGSNSKSQLTRSQISAIDSFQHFTMVPKKVQVKSKIASLWKKKPNESQLSC